MIQSSAVTEGRAGYPPPRLGNAAEVSRGARTRRTTSAANGPAGPSRRPPARRSPTRSQQRLIAVLAVCGLAFVVGLVVGARHEPAGQEHVERFAAAWERGDYAAMYSELTADAIATACPARASPPPTSDALRHRDGDARSTRPSRARTASAYRVPVRIPTRAFGTVARRGRRCPPTGDGVDWSRALVFPGLRGRRAPAPRDEDARARHAAGPRPHRAGQGRRPLLAVAARAAGRRRARPDPARAPRGARRARRAARRRGRRRRPRADLRRAPAGHAGRRAASPARACSSAPARARPRAVRTTISLPVEQAAVTALGARLGGVVALQPRTGEVLAFAGIAFSGLQPPGSTFKIITTTGALEAGITNPQKTYPGPAEGRARGRRPRERQRRVLRRHARRRPSPSRATRSSPRSASSSGPSASSPPPSATASTRRRTSRARPRARSRAAGEIGDDLAVGSSAIGQGRVQATALQMATVAAAIGLRGRRPHLTLDYDAAHGRAASTERATSAKVARTMERLMLAVVRGGTGTRGGDPRRARGGQDRHRRAAHDQEVRARPRASPRAARPRTRPTTRPTPTPGSPPTPPPARAARTSRSACCWSPRGPAATPPRPRRATSCSPA